KTFKNIAECRARGIRILPPDVNESREDFTVLAQADDNGRHPIRFGLCAVRGVGSKAVETILATRDAHGPFTSLGSFCKRVLAAKGVGGVVPAAVPVAARSAAGGGEAGAIAANGDATKAGAPRANGNGDSPAASQVNKKVIESLIK